MDGDDYLADKNVLADIRAFTTSHPDYDIVDVGFLYFGQYEVGKVGWPIAPWGRIIRPSVYVKSPDMNIPYANDVYPHFVMFD